MKKSQNIIKFLVFAFFGILVIYFVQKDFKYQEFLNNLNQSKWYFVLCSTLVGVLAVLIRAARWKLMLNPMGFKTSLSHAYHATMSGYFVNLGIPRAGEVYRCAIFSKTDKVPLNTLVGTVLSERIIDMMMLVIVIISSVLIQVDVLYGYINEKVLSKLSFSKLIWVGIGLILVIVILYFLFQKIFSKNSFIKNMIEGFVNGLKSVFKLQQPLLFIIYTLLIWVCYFFMTYFIVLAFPFAEYLGVAGALSVLVFSTLGVIIPAPAGIATISSIQLGLQSIYNFPQSDANSMAIVMFFANIAMIVVSGGISFIILAFKTKFSK